MDSKVTQNEKYIITIKISSTFQNIQSNKYVKHIGRKMHWNKTHFPSLNTIIGKPYPYESKGVLIHYNYPSNPMLGLGIVAIKIISCN